MADTDAMVGIVQVAFCYARLAQEAVGVKAPNLQAGDNEASPTGYGGGAPILLIFSVRRHCRK